LVRQEARTLADQRRRLNARIALLAFDGEPADDLASDLYDTDVANFKPVCDALRPYHLQWIERLWSTLRDQDQSAARRFRAGLAIAAFAPDSSRWTESDQSFLVEQLVSANPEDQPRLRDCLRPIRNRLLPFLERRFHQPSLEELETLTLASTLADFAAGDSRRLANLVAVASPRQFAILFPSLVRCHDAASHGVLCELVGDHSLADLSVADRLNHARRRAGAAIALIRLGDPEPLSDALITTQEEQGAVVENCDGLTQFVHGCRLRDVRPSELLECVGRCDQRRQAMSGENRRRQDQVFFGLLLALGEFPIDRLPSESRASIVDQLTNWYSLDPSASVHAAAGWLLRHWQQGDIARRVDQVAVPYAPGREWFTMEIKAASAAGPQEPSREHTFYLTFVVFPAGTYLVGSPLTDPLRESVETRHRCQITRPFAILDREITRKEMEVLGITISGNERTCPTPDHPMGGICWYDAIRFCRLLSEASGCAEDDQPYPDPEILDPQRYPADPHPVAVGAPINWPLRLDRRGFRLPTEHEWEIACRAGADSTFSFGNDPQWLDRYAWFNQNSRGQGQLPRGLRPNLRGLFDMHGNVWEWCHDWHAEYPEGDAIDPLGAPLRLNRIYRSSSWDDPVTNCRSSIRHRHVPVSRFSGFGCRVAMTLNSSPCCTGRSPLEEDEARRMAVVVQNHMLHRAEPGGALARRTAVVVQNHMLHRAEPGGARRANSRRQSFR
jgi:formylglycine-generating enzyme required for sulfatase activity